MYSAKRKIKNTDGVMLHSDQGWYYQHMQYQKRLKKYGMVQSMSRKGNCLDDVVMENFFKGVKRRWFDSHHLWWLFFLVREKKIIIFV